MKYCEKVIKSDKAYLIPIGDIHIGDKMCNYEALQSHIDWVLNEPDAYIVGIGDWLNVATRSSKSSPFQQDLTLQEQVEKCIKLFMPVKHKIIGMVSGNHEQRLEDLCGYDPLSPIAHALNIPYWGVCAVGCLVVGKKRPIAYTMFVHHTTGGGNTVGAKLNRIDKLRGIVSNCDLYMGGHNHQLGTIPVLTRTVDVIHKKVIEKRQMLVDCGSFLNWEDGYAERMMLQPAKLGCPRIRLNGDKRDIHCSL